MEAWRIIFFVTVGLYIIEFTVFTIWGSGEEQPWSKGATNHASEQLDMTDNNSKPITNGQHTAQA